MTIPMPSVLRSRTDPNLAAVDALSTELDKANIEYDGWDRYYSGDQPLAFMSPEVEAQIGGRLTPLVINWPETIVDSVARRLNPEGFRLGQGAVTDDELWRIFTANDLDEESPLGIVDMLVHGLTFLSVWGNDDDPLTPRMDFESAHQVTVRYDPGGRSVRDGLKKWQDGSTTYARYWTRDESIRYAAHTAALGVQPRYEIDQVLPNPLRAVPIVPMVNKGRLLNRSGRSELASIAPIADGINKLATDLLVTAEFYTTPRRYATGMQMPSGGGDMERLKAEVKAYWDEAKKEKTWLAGQGVQFGQFPEATLDGFVAGINLLTASLAAIGGLPPDDLGLNTTNPASAEARRAAETVLILRAKEKQRAAGGSYARAMRLAVAARDGLALANVPQEFSRMQVAWQEPATPAIAQAMDAAQKGLDSGIYDVEAAQEVVGMSPIERAAVRARAQEAAALAATASVRAQLELADELVSTRGLTQNAALAAVGLLQAAGLNANSA